MKKVIQMLLIFSTVILLPGCYYFDEREESWQTFYSQYSYSNKKGVDNNSNIDQFLFIKLEGTPTPLQMVSGNPALLSQSDYFSIANAISTFAMGDASENFNLGEMDFGVECEEAMFGPQNAHLQFFQLQEKEGKRIRTVREINIEPQKSLVSIRETDFFPVINQWSSIDLQSINITVDKALQIAEGSGGQEIREKIKNQCTINLVLNSDSNYTGWEVEYISEGKYSLPIVEYQIDPQTGDVKVIEY